MDLTDEQWEVVRPLIPVPFKRTDGRGRPKVEDRKILDGILWVMRTGASWHDLPDKYPPYQTCHCYFQQWRSAGVFKSIIESLARDLKDRGDLDLSECFIDGSFVIAKKGVKWWERPSGVRVRRSWQWQRALVFLSPYSSEVLRHMRLS
jgi:transposase